MSDSNWREQLAAKEAKKAEAKKATGWKSKAQEMKDKNAATWTFSDTAIPGAGVYLCNIQVGTAQLPCYADSHQGKHVLGNWPDGPKQEGAYFYEVSSSNTGLLRRIAENVSNWAAGDKSGGQDYVMNCVDYIGESGDSPASWVWIQGGIITSHGRRHISFHAIPITEAEGRLKKNSSSYIACSDL